MPATTATAYLLHIEPGYKSHLPEVKKLFSSYEVAHAALVGYACQFWGFWFDSEPALVEQEELLNEFFDGFTVSYDLREVPLPR